VDSLAQNIAYMHRFYDLDIFKNTMELYSFENWLEKSTLLLDNGPRHAVKIAYTWLQEENLPVLD